MKTKLFILTAAALLTTNSFAEGGEKRQDSRTFEEKKAMMMKHMDEKIKMISQAKSCISNAVDKEGLKACHKAMKEMYKGKKRGKGYKRREGKREQE